jgi:hypothetical protein
MPRLADPYRSIWASTTSCTARTTGGINRTIAYYPGARAAALERAAVGVAQIEVEVDLADADARAAASKVARRSLPPCELMLRRSRRVSAGLEVELLRHRVAAVQVADGSRKLCPGGAR